MNAEKPHARRHHGCWAVYKNRAAENPLVIGKDLGSALRFYFNKVALQEAKMEALRSYRKDCGMLNAEFVIQPHDPEKDTQIQAIAFDRRARVTLTFPQTTTSTEAAAVVRVINREVARLTVEVSK
jgi:hypothetical protein